MTLALATLLTLAAPATPGPSAPVDVIARPPTALALAPYYRKYLDAQGIPIVSSGRVPDRALREAREIVNHMLRMRPDVRRALVSAHARVAVMAESEVTTDIPEHAHLDPYMNTRARGLGGWSGCPVTSCAEENLLQYPGDRYRGDSILVHEFAHTLYNLGLTAVDPTFAARFSRVHSNAMRRGLFKNTYAASSDQEYWAEGVQSWFDANLQASPANGIHNDINTRGELERYDPELAHLIAEAFGDNPWRWSAPPRIGPDPPRGGR
jgi:hypothetical protein